MSIQKLTSIARRGSMLAAVFAIVAATFAQATPTFADSLNPLTERSLTLSSSAPGWENTDGSGNSTYAPPNSGANGQKSGNYFSFKVSSDSQPDVLKAMTFQYCTKSAGDCIAPGDGTTAGHANLNVTYPSATEVSATDFPTVIDTTSGDVKAVPGYTNSNPKYQSSAGNATGSNGTGDPAEAAKNVAGNFIVMSKSGGVWGLSEGWTAATSNQEEATGTGAQNTIVLENTTGTGFTAGQEVKVLFFATNDNYITNPGSGAFFVKINTFKNFTTLSSTDHTDLANQVATPGNVLDGGVTVANVMNQSIQITTKVLETMQFSVGTVDPNTLTKAELTAAGGGAEHTPCDTIKTSMTSGSTANVLELGDQASESSLSTNDAYATHSYWRLSSNSSAGATVYYSGHTLSNTSGDEIKPIGKTAKQSAPGSEQFGLAISAVPSTDSTGNGKYEVNYNQDSASGKEWENAADNGKTAIDPSVITDNTTSGTLNPSYHTPQLYPLQPETGYGNGSGTINGTDSLDASGAPATGSSTAAQFAFDPMSDTIPTAIATESSQVVDCVTAKMRYVANIAATTPAGIYTTKINYIAAPQY